VTASRRLARAPMTSKKKKPLGALEGRRRVDRQ
jgi:hypothetical protein